MGRCEWTDVEEERVRFEQHLRWATEEVKSWPLWKQNLLRGGPLATEVIPKPRHIWKEVVPGNDMLLECVICHKRWLINKPEPHTCIPCLRDPILVKAILDCHSMGWVKYDITYSYPFFLNPLTS